ncbi:4'-phosphopantetheinyl transferase family protein [Kordiimonas pumila]|uniref:4'-phosphopantetheinyl transferase family protein n=1 Tax=Kordiimonas pumila TaxID=2161677 RepID=A0ABV7D4C1_9PROT|nr:4'-phosphopantetheinyl transferase superfamily protein [Kordiimonas pumila]
MTGDAGSLERVKIKIRAADAALTKQDMLSEAEHARLAGMHEGARPAFVTARTMLREMLGGYMGLLPGAVPLHQAGAGRRVRLDGFSQDEPPFFSVSHTGGAEDGISAIAVSETTPIGIDIQQIDPEIQWQRVAERRFPEAEAELLLAMPESEGQMLFFTLWAIKESFVKMEDGTLMSYLRQIELDMTDGQFSLKVPSPKGTKKAHIFFHYIPEFEMAIAAVAASPVVFELDSTIMMANRRPDPLSNSA